jgi:hypothetical protein
MALVFLLLLILLSVWSSRCLHGMNVVRVSERVWRRAAEEHKIGVLKLLRSGLLLPPSRRSQWTALDPKHPVYNFLIEYYGLKGVKGVKRLARWSPGPLEQQGGIHLEGASEKDFGETLHLKGASFERSGVLYSPLNLFGEIGSQSSEHAAKAAAPYLWYRSVLEHTSNADPVLRCHGPCSISLREHRPLPVPSIRRTCRCG